MSIKSQKDLVAGLLFLGIGLFFTIASLEYRLGTPSRMGPGFFPLILGLILAALGAGVAVGAMRGAHEPAGDLETLNFRGLIIVVFATLLFAILIPSMGLLVTLPICAAVTSFAGRGANLRVICINVAVQLIIGFGIFHKLLGLQIPLLPVFIGS